MCGGCGNRLQIDFSSSSGDSRPVGSHEPAIVYEDGNSVPYNATTPNYSGGDSYSLRSGYSFVA